MATKTTIDQNQYTYLTNLANGKTETGGVASAGQRAWAKTQLASSNYTPPKTTTTPKASSAVLNLATKYPTTPTSAVGNPNATNSVVQAAQQAAKAQTQQSQTPTTTFVPRLEQTVSDFKTAIDTPFTYDPNSDQAFQAYLAQAKKALNLNQNNTTANLYANGQGDSSYSEAVARQMANSGAQDIENQMITTYLPQAYQQYKDRLGNLQDLYNLEYQQDVTTPMNEAQLTGNYLSGPSREALQQLISLKTQAEDPSTPAAQRGVLSQQADKIRAFLQSQGLDPSLFGSNVSASQAAQNMSQAGTRTLAGQSADLDRQNANLNAALNVGQASGKLITPQSDWSGLYRQATNSNTPANYTAQQQQIQNLWAVADATGTIPNELADIYGLPRGMSTFAAKQAAIQNSQNQQQIGISAMNARTSASNAANSAANDRFNQLMDVWNATGVAPSGLESYGIKSGTALPMQSSGSKSYDYKTDPDFMSDYQSAITDPNGFSSYFSNNPQQFISKYGIDGYNALKSLVDGG